MTFQKTLKKAVSLSGIGLHSGKRVDLTIKPARPNEGIRFVRVDLEGAPVIAAHYKNVVNTQLATTLGNGSVAIGTVEHLMAALYGLGIDNATIEVNAPEVPILDGSSIQFFNAMNAAGIQTQLQVRPTLAIRKKIEIKVDEKWAVAEPSSKMEIHGSIEFDHPSIGYQEYHYVRGETDFSELAVARTFCYLREVEQLRSMGLARGGSLDNAVVLDDAQVLNPGGLRAADEFVKHKVLDALGDFMLAGISVQGYFRLHRAGHDLHSQLLKTIFRDPNNYEIIDASARGERRPSRVTAMLSRLAASVS